MDTRKVIAETRRALAESSGQFPLGGDFLEYWVSDPDKPLWAIEELAADPQINGEIKVSQEGQWVDVPGEAFIKLVRGEWQAFQYAAGYNPPG